MKFLTHNRDKVGDYQFRVLVHLPIGFIMGIIPFSRGLVDLFIAYEENEDVHTKDQAWKDYAGALGGYMIGRIMLAGIIVWLLIRWFA